MSIEVYTKDLSNRHEITHAISIQMTAFYNDIGKIALIVPIDDYNINALELGGIIYDTERDLSYTIQYLKYDTDTNRINCNGYTCNWLLNKRCEISHRTVTNVESSVYAAVTENLRGLSPVTIDQSKGLTETADAEWYGGQILDNIISVLDTVELGHRMKWDAVNMQHVFEVYKGNDLTNGIHAVVFSDEQGTAENLAIIDDVSAMKNFVYVPAQLTTDEEILETYGDVTGNDRYEYWLNSSTRQTNEETESDLRFRIKGEAAAEIARCPRRQNFTVDIDASDYRKIYNLGDKVACVSTRFGVQFEARITGVKYRLDVTGAKTSITLGKPALTALGEVKLFG